MRCHSGAPLGDCAGVRRRRVGGVFPMQRANVHRANRREQGWERNRRLEEINGGENCNR
jgi:hypothetical protein